MIISFKHRFIFIKTAKTAGTSIELELSKHCGPDDVITPLIARDEKIRIESGGRAAQNYKVPWHKYSLGQFWLALRLKKRAQLRNHDSIFMAERLFQIDRGDFYVFAVERNPFDKLRSLADYWGQGAQIRKDSNAWLSAQGRVPKPQGWELYANEKGIVADRIYLFEELDDLEKEMMTRFGIQINLGSTITKKSPYNSTLDLNWNEASRSLIRDAFASELEMFYPTLI